MNCITSPSVIRKLFLFFCSIIVVLNATAQDYVITDYGVSTDSTELNTRAIQNVIDKANENGGGS